MSISLKSLDNLHLVLINGLRSSNLVSRVLIFFLLWHLVPPYCAGKVFLFFLMNYAHGLAGKLFLASTASWCPDKRFRETRKGLKADENRNANVEHRINVNRCQSGSCEE